jgi:hypothetical protein
LKISLEGDYQSSVNLRKQETTYSKYIEENFFLVRGRGIARRKDIQVKAVLALGKLWAARVVEDPE